MKANFEIPNRKSGRSNGDTIMNNAETEMNFLLQEINNKMYGVCERNNEFTFYYSTVSSFHSTVSVCNSGVLSCNSTVSVCNNTVLSCNSIISVCNSAVLSCNSIVSVCNSAVLSCNNTVSFSHSTVSNRGNSVSKDKTLMYKIEKYDKTSTLAVSYKIQINYSSIKFYYYGSA
jgi:hypothetical protein